MATLEQQLEIHSKIGLDTSIFIYYLEKNTRYLSISQQILEEVSSDNLQAVISTVTIMELTVQPWRNVQEEVARGYETFLVNFPNLTIMDANREVARKGAQLRAKYNLRPADALQVATTIVGGATVWCTNDKKLKRVAPEIEVIVLDDFLKTDG
ncbi:MAG: PIN domain-containing protein [Chloroflexota bacterium]